MAARYSAGFSISGTNTANTQCANLANTGTTQRLYVVEIAIGVAVAPTTAPQFYISRATARGTQTATLAGQAHDAGDASAIGTVDSTWSAAPTFSTSNFIRMGSLAVTAGGLIIWTFYDKPIVVDKATTAGLVIANKQASGTTTGTFSGYFSWDE